MRQTVEQVGRVGCSTNTPTTATTPATTPLAERAPPEAPASSRPAAPLGVGGEVDRREERAHDHGHHAAEHRRGVQPAPRARRRSASPAGTRPDATPPTTAPSMYGVITDDDANVDPEQPAQRQRRDALRNANAAPRRMMPTAASVSGTYSVDMIGANAVGKPVHSVTSTKISQTWLASHTGPIDSSINARVGAPVLGTAGDEVPEPGAEVGTREQRVERDPDEHHRRARRRRASRQSPRRLTRHAELGRQRHARAGAARSP